MSGNRENNEGGRASEMWVGMRTTCGDTSMVVGIVVAGRTHVFLATREVFGRFADQIAVMPEAPISRIGADRSRVCSRRTERTGSGWPESHREGADPKPGMRGITVTGSERRGLPRSARRSGSREADLAICRVAGRRMAAARGKGCGFAGVGLNGARASTYCRTGVRKRRGGAIHTLACSRCTPAVLLILRCGNVLRLSGRVARGAPATRAVAGATPLAEGSVRARGEVEIHTSPPALPGSLPQQRSLREGVSAPIRVGGPAACRPSGRRVAVGVNRGEESSKVNQDCTICRFSSWSSSPTQLAAVVVGDGAELAGHGTGTARGSGARLLASTSPPHRLKPSVAGQPDPRGQGAAEWHRPSVSAGAPPALRSGDSAPRLLKRRVWLSPAPRCLRRPGDILAGLLPAVRSSVGSPVCGSKPGPASGARNGTERGLGRPGRAACADLIENPSQPMTFPPPADTTTG